jgi:transposase
MLKKSVFVKGAALDGMRRLVSRNRVKLFARTRSAKGDQPMQKHIKSALQLEKPVEQPSITVGLDLGDRFSQYCMLNRDSEVVETGRIQTTEAALRRHFEGEPTMRVALECGTHSAWISRLLEQLGHQVLVANTRKIRAITASESKNDRNDAEKLARFAAHDPRLLSPIRHRSAERQRDLDLIHARSTLVGARTMIVNSLRGLVKSAGGRLPACSTASFRTRAQAAVPATLTAAARPLLEQVEALNRNIVEMDRLIEQLAVRYPEIELLRTAPGVGPVVAATYLLTLDSKDKVRHSRQAGAFLGLRPRQSQSGDSDPQNRIAKTGNVYLRSLLVQAAQYVLGRFGPDSELRRWGLKLAASAGKRGKKRAIVAVARKLAVILHRMWQTRDRWQPFPQPVREQTRTA